MRELRGAYLRERGGQVSEGHSPHMHFRHGPGHLRGDRLSGRASAAHWLTSLAREFSA